MTVERETKPASLKIGVIKFLHHVEDWLQKPPKTPREVEIGRRKLLQRIFWISATIGATGALGLFIDWALKKIWEAEEQKYIPNWQKTPEVRTLIREAKEKGFISLRSGEKGEDQNIVVGNNTYSLVLGLNPTKINELLNDPRLKKVKDYNPKIGILILEEGYPEVINLGTNIKEVLNFYESFESRCLYKGQLDEAEQDERVLDEIREKKRFEESLKFSAGLSYILVYVLQEDPISDDENVREEFYEKFRPQIEGDLRLENLPFLVLATEGDWLVPLN